MKRTIMIIFAIITGALSAYALYSVIGYFFVWLSYPVLVSSQDKTYFGGNLIMLCVAFAVLVVAGVIFAVLMKKLIGHVVKVKFDK